MPSTSEIPPILRTIVKLVEVFQKHHIDYMLIEGLALAHYGQIRATQDVDAAVLIENVCKLTRVYREFEERGFEIPSSPDIEAACIYLLDRENLVDVELWLRPDGVSMDSQLLNRRRCVLIYEGVNVWVIGPEDFIVNKLARRDRSALDESDVVSVLAFQGTKLDRGYLRERAKKAGVLNLLEALEERTRRMMFKSL